MSALQRFLALPRADQALLIRTGALLIAARVGLWMLPFGVVRRALAGRTHPAMRGCDAADAAPLDRVLWAVRVAARRVPGSTCFTQALVAEGLLRRAGHADATLRIGVARSAQTGAFAAHAWVEAQGTVVLGQRQSDEAMQFVPMPAF